MSDSPLSDAHRTLVAAARHNRVTRRRFLQATTLAGAGAFAMPYLVPRSAFGANDRVVSGHIGVGRQGGSNLGRFLGAKTQAVAVCDVDQKHRESAARKSEEKGNKVEQFGDYRKLLERDDIDVVVISTPDHWHAKTVIDACEAGKDVYCEKPLSLTIAEGRKMVEAARNNKRIVQTGSQQRSGGQFRKACELVRSGKLGDVKQVLVGIPRPNHPGKLGPDTDPPAELDYNFWLGPAPERPYNVKRVHYNFRFFWDYSGGQMTNFGAHDIDIAQWGLGMDESGPVECWGTAEYHPEGYHEVTEKCRIHFKYANGVELIVGQQQKDIPGGCTFIGSKGKIHVTRGGLKSDPAEIAKTELTDDDVRLYRSSNHVGNFLDCVKSRELPVADVEIGHRTATICHLGNIVAKLGRKIAWDPAKEQITGDDEAAAMVSRPHREPWSV